ncbi:MAG: aminotransferase class I/II-fold pyridoxal phosphate-dependent enzyme, partial [Brevinematia bacterium]
MFSRRLNYPFVKNQLSEILDSKDKKSLLNLIESNPTKTGFSYNKKLLKYFLKDENLSYEPDPKGLKVARDCISVYYKERNICVDPEDIFVTPGTSEAYSYIFKILCDPHENILIPLPGYPLFEYLASLDVVNTKPYRLTYIHGAGWQIDFDSILNAIDERTKAIVLINPNNPTGSYILPEERKRIIEIAKTFKISIIVDEVFFDFNIDEKAERYSFADEKEVLT